MHSVVSIGGDEVGYYLVCPYCGDRFLYKIYQISTNKSSYFFHSCSNELRVKEIEEMHRDFFVGIYKRLLKNGRISSPRGLKILEIENFCCVFKPYVRFVNFKDRKFKIDYVKREFLWYLRGNKYDTSICQYAKMWNKFICVDGSINSNYGQYIFGHINQFQYVIDTLMNDKDSRRACIMILQPYHLLYPMPEIPCTYSLSFRIRENKLNMTVHMRSQDAIIGFASDIPIFSFIHEMIWVYLRDKKYSDLTMGDYFHNVDSFHVYEKHFQLLDKICSDSEYSLIKTPPIKDSKEVEMILRMGKEKINYDDIPDGFEFCRWLKEVEK